MTTTFVCWKWEPKEALHLKKQITFSHHHVNALYGMLKRFLHKPFRLICVTDNASGINPEIQCIPLWSTFRELGGCYVRLPAFRDAVRGIFGDSFFSIDLDVVILHDITSLVDDAETNSQFKIWGDTHPRTPYNGSFFYMKTGCRAQVFENFNPRTSPAEGKRRGYVGTDQAWIAACLGRKEERWTTADGIFSYRVHFKEQKRKLQGNEKIVFFHGSSDPSKPDTQREASWMQEYWQPGGDFQLAALPPHPPAAPARHNVLPPDKYGRRRR